MRSSNRHICSLRQTTPSNDSNWARRSGSSRRVGCCCGSLFSTSAHLLIWRTRCLGPVNMSGLETGGGHVPVTTKCSNTLAVCLVGSRVFEEVVQRPGVVGELLPTLRSGDQGDGARHARAGDGAARQSGRPWGQARAGTDDLATLLRAELVEGATAGVGKN